MRDAGSYEQDLTSHLQPHKEVNAEINKSGSFNNFDDKLDVCVKLYAAIISIISRMKRGEKLQGVAAQPSALFVCKFLRPSISNASFDAILDFIAALVHIDGLACTALEDGVCLFIGIFSLHQQGKAVCYTPLSCRKGK
ncbi:hypothetical protein GOP47_0017695 [Adiantum capillus-veneris]|uniref:Uncharacterized protein n=1 Tax=Adiantum capillus-veneris TaxID=13818 RepID=A0A9D4UGC1_ADICA|nr:hypothetical protein GOP47_0017695 [Adiantum capillus-veneris]